MKYTIAKSGHIGSLGNKQMNMVHSHETFTEDDFWSEFKSELKGYTKDDEAKYEELLSKSKVFLAEGKTVTINNRTFEISKR